jgi:hypothetical protein
MSPVLISHRGNVDCATHPDENKQEYIQKAINLGYDVEVDVRLVEGKLFLGHDGPDYEVTLPWLVDRKDYLWIHTKNFAALSYLIDLNLRIFYHSKEDHVVINNCNFIWSHNLDEADENSIIPLLGLSDISNFERRDVYGICSDYVSTLELEPNNAI